jgi:O-acetylserine/cysteine efflux transporter
MKLVDALLALLVIMVWGFNFVAGKWGLAQVPPVLLMCLRFTLVALLLLPFVRAPRGKLGAIALLSVTLGTVHFSLMFAGMARLDAGIASIVVQTQVPIAAIFSAVWYRDYLGWRRGLGMLIAFAGVVVLAGEPRNGPDFIPLLLIIGAAAFWALANIQIKELGAIDGFALNAYLALFCAPQLLITSLILEDGQWTALANADIRVPVSLLFMAVVVTIFSYRLWYRLLHRYAVNQVMPFMLLVPPFAVLAGVLFLDEPVGWRVIIGGLLTVGGVGVIVLRRPRLVAPQAAAETS